MAGSPSSRMQVPEGHPLDVDAVVRALSTQFDVATGARHVVRRRSLDTFDRRLRAAGLALEHRSAPSGDRLVLDRAQGSSVVAQVGALAWPAFAAVLPDGPVRDAVAPVSGIRALMVVSDTEQRVQQVDLRNSARKTVARVELEEPLANDAAGPAVLTVRTLRGYDEQARRAARLLATIGLRPGGDRADGADGADSADDGHVAGGAGIPPPGAIRSGADATLLLASVLNEFVTAMRENLPGLLDDVDTEFLHDFRVAVRRTRSTLKLGRSALPESFRDDWEPAFKWLGDLTTPQRDLDVYELDLPMMATWLVAADSADLDPLAAHLRRRRTQARNELVAGLTSARFTRLIDDWGRTLAQLAQAGETGRPITAGELSAQGISRAYRRVLRAAVDADSPAEDVHTLRKRCKELRYALEVFAPVIDKPSRRRAVTDLKHVQDVLGRFQDCEVQGHALREFADEMVAEGTTAGAVLAMGELVGHLDVEQARARHDVHAAFARFTRPASRRRLDRLGGAK